LNRLTKGLHGNTASARACYLFLNAEVDALAQNMLAEVLAIALLPITRPSIVHALSEDRQHPQVGRAGQGNGNYVHDDIRDGVGLDPFEDADA
jgi:hypothetical protein